MESQSGGITAEGLFAGFLKGDPNAQAAVKTALGFMSGGELAQLLENTADLDARLASAPDLAPSQRDEAKQLLLAAVRAEVAQRSALAQEENHGRN